MSELVDLKTFTRVATAGSFTKAARSLGLTASVASKSIARLEAHLGVKLFVRTTRSVRLTDVGNAFLEKVTRVLRDLEDAERIALDARSTPRGLLRIDVPVTLGARRVAPLLPAFCRKYPDIELAVTSDDRLVNLAAEDVDVAVRVGELADARLVARRIGSSRVVTLAAPSYLRKRGRARVPEDLAHHVCLTFRSTNSGRTLAWRFASGGRDSRFVPERAHVFTSTEAMLSAASAGLGVTQLLDFSAGPARARGELVPILENLQVEGPPVSLVYRPERGHLPKVRAFSDFMAEAFATKGAARQHR